MGPLYPKMGCTWAVEMRGDRMKGASQQPIIMLGESLRANMKTRFMNHAEGSRLSGLLKRCPVTASSKGTACLKVPCAGTTISIVTPCQLAAK